MDVQKLKHIIYRAKTWLLYKSKPALWFRKAIWRQPAKDVVKIVFSEDQDITAYFDWSKISNQVAAVKLQEFTLRYAKEPNVVYEFDGDLLIEPEYGLVINQGREFIRQSGTLGHIYLRPSLYRYLLQKGVSRKYTIYDQIIHCDGFAGKNLCHFVYDTINPIIFLYVRRLMNKDSPILVAKRVYDKPYFQYFLKNSFLGELNWVVQAEGEWIRVKKVRKAFVSMEIFKTTYNLISPVIKSPKRRVFLNRKSQFQRNILNIDSLLKVLTHYEFENVYAEDLTYEQQVALFRDVKYFVGIHGAGLTNLLHSEIPKLRVLEIFSESLVHASFYRFLEILNVEYYDAIAGTTFDINWNFSVDIDEFELAMRRLIAN